VITSTPLTRLEVQTNNKNNESPGFNVSKENENGNASISSATDGD